MTDRNEAPPMYAIKLASEGPAQLTDQQVVARAETNWVFVKLADGRPTPIPDELGRSFELIPDEEDVLVTLGLRPAGG